VEGGVMAEVALSPGAAAAKSLMVAHLHSQLGLDHHSRPSATFLSLSDLSCTAVEGAFWAEAGFSDVEMSVSFLALLFGRHRRAANPQIHHLSIGMVEPAGVEDVHTLCNQKTKRHRAN
jgi:hypothetical protein